MPIWLTIVLCIIFLYIGYIISGYLHKDKIIGTLFIDQNDGVYTVWDIDPKKLKDNDIIKMDVQKVDIKDLWMKNLT